LWKKGLGPPDAAERDGVKSGTARKESGMYIGIGTIVLVLLVILLVMFVF
jgi:hypothetical protein